MTLVIQMNVVTANFPLNAFVQIMLEYLGGKSEVDWCYPNECQLKNKRQVKLCYFLLVNLFSASHEILTSCQP